MNDTPVSRPSVSSGIPGLDDVLVGGFTPDRLYLIEGVPGSGKTTLAMQFLLEGIKRGEKALYVSLSETEEELREVAASHGWDLDGLHIHELSPPQDRLDPDAQYTMFHPSEVELGDTTKRMLEEVERLNPQRLVFDSLAELRLLAGSALRYRRQVLALKQYTPPQLREAAQVLSAWPLVASGTEGYRTAEVTLGGVDTADVSSSTMESRRVPGLHFIGEVLDVTGWLGGYNFQWAWASGHAAGQAV